MKTTYRTARTEPQQPEAFLRAAFGELCTGTWVAQWTDSTRKAAVGVCGLTNRAPVLGVLFGRREWRSLVGVRPQESLMVVWDSATSRVSVWMARPESAPTALTPSADQQAVVREVLEASATWAGELDEQGCHHFDPRSPSPGPHFGANLLVGDRTAFAHPLQTTPKSVVDGWGRGSFRSHAGTQVLATRWDLRQEENGFPANRQFYLTEDDQAVFYSGASDSNWDKAHCVHAPNETTINVSTRCSLDVRRHFSLLSHEQGLPLACEVQEITLTNRGGASRSLRLVYTGMFGPTKPGALMEDVLYSNIIMQAGMLTTQDGAVLALAPDYHPIHDRTDVRFQSLVLFRGDQAVFPVEFGTDYREFVGQGSLERPEGVGRLSNRLHRKGPGFFALGIPFELAAGQSVTIVSFTGLVSTRDGEARGPESLPQQVERLIQRFTGLASLSTAAEARRDQRLAHQRFLQIKTGRAPFDAWVNHNLPFQVYYQTFVSRSFCQTQKGYREIGFREIQDLFASMSAFCAQGRGSLVESLIGQWASQVHEMGFANHNFYWEGKEPGLWSDDALWLVQALGRYIELTGKIEFLDTPCPVAGSAGQSRSLFETVVAIVRYSGRLSVGRHGLPLLDRADWNDCLKVDVKHPSGPEKARVWKDRLAQDPNSTEVALDSDGTESVMNAFLLVVAADQLEQFALRRGDKKRSEWARRVSDDMAQACRTHAWKGQWFARLLVNRPGAPHPVVGVPGDGLEAEGIEAAGAGSLFINSFSWAVLSGSASEEQIASMYRLLESRLKTPHGYRLVTPHDLRRVEPSVASAEYFPGDRENGAVFKHASLMAVAALFKAATWVKDSELARQMCQSAWAMIDLAAPPRALSDPFVLAGNPRFCTQYNNSETGENIGPLLSGTASWATLALRQGLGLNLTPEGLHLDPLLREADKNLTIELKWMDEVYQIRFLKKEGFVRSLDQKPQVLVDGKPYGSLVLPRRAEPGITQVVVEWN